MRDYEHDFRQWQWAEQEGPLNRVIGEVESVNPDDQLYVECTWSG